MENSMEILDTYTYDSISKKEIHRRDKKVRTSGNIK
jgi:hypothetical protein